MADVFDALASAHRRQLLDALRERDGRTLGELEGCLPLSRFAVMKHLGVLEDAGLVITRKVGREKRHFLNPIPIQQLSDRWIDKYARPFTRAMVELHAQFPQYGFDRLKGYPSPLHLAALREHGPCAQHRRSFAPVQQVLRL